VLDKSRAMLRPLKYHVAGILKNLPIFCAGVGYLSLLHCFTYGVPKEAGR
jgi:hypothetical protein